MPVCVYVCVCVCVSQLYQSVQRILEPWPHLVKLFTEFLEPHDCLEAEAVSPIVWGTIINMFVVVPLLMCLFVNLFVTCLFLYYFVYLLICLFVMLCKWSLCFPHSAGG